MRKYPAKDPLDLNSNIAGPEWAQNCKDMYEKIKHNDDGRYLP